MSPLIKQVDDFLYEKRINKQTFLCELVNYIPEEDKTCSEAWLKAGYRWFTSEITPRPQTQEAIKQWLEDNQNREVVR